MALLPTRTARIVLVTPDGQLLGAFPPVPVPTPWWQDIAPVVDAVRAAYGIHIIVLRLLTSEKSGPPGGEVTYLAETEANPQVDPWPGTIGDDPLRLPYAKPGGPAADLAWAETSLAERGFAPTGRAIQVRTWNLSSLWKIPVGAETMWLKSVPPFFAHEGPLIGAMAGSPVPDLIAFDRGRMLIREIPGEDGYSAQLPALKGMLCHLVELQTSWIGRENELLQLGLPDWRDARLTQMIQDVVEKHKRFCPIDDAAALEHFAENLPARFALIEECGIPNTLVHGDFHPGNVRVNGQKLTLIDWGDSGIGHPLLDQSAFLENQPESDLKQLEELWIHLWESALPGSSPATAAKLLHPIGVARRAAIYDGFLEQIEPSEHPYHRSDPVDWLQRTAALMKNPTP